MKAQDRVDTIARSLGSLLRTLLSVQVGHCYALAGKIGKNYTK